MVNQLLTWFLIASYCLAFSSALSLTAFFLCDKDAEDVYTKVSWSDTVLVRERNKRSVGAGEAITTAGFSQGF